MYQATQLPYIASAFQNVSNASVEDVTNISPTILDLVKNEVLDLLACMFIIPISQRAETTRRSARLLPQNDVLMPDIAPRERRNTSTLEDGDSGEEERDESSGGRGFVLVPTVITAVQAAKDSMSLTYEPGLRHQWFEEGKYKEIGSLEIAASEAHTGGDLESTNRKISNLGGIPRTQAQFDAIKSISKSELNGKLKNFQTLKSEIEEGVNAFIPDDCFCFGDGQFLLEWIKEGQRFTRGERLPRETHEICKDNDQLWLTTYQLISYAI